MMTVLYNLALFIGFTLGEVGLDCSSRNDLPFLTERVAGYIRSSTELPISDFYLNEDCYSIPGFKLSSDPSNKCGSQNFWYMKDSTLPETDTIFMKTICFADGSDCIVSKQIQVKRCSENDYRFCLPPTDATDEAYCTSPLNASVVVDPAPNVTYITPKIEVRIATLGTSEFVLEFVCDFIVKPDDRKLLYSVEWAITDTSGKVKHLQTTTSNKSNEAQFIDETKLTQSTLESHGIDRLGFRTMCSVRAKLSSVGKYSPAMNSESKFCGIEVLSQSEIRVEGNEKVIISVRLTVPFRCRTSSSTCTYDLLLFAPKSYDSCKTQSIRTADTDNSKICGARFNTTDVDKIKNITITNFHGQTSTNKIGNVQNVIFRTRSLVGHKFFSGYVPDPIRIYSLVDYQMVSKAWCYSHGDPYVKSFDTSYAFAIQEAGTFMLYRNKEYNIEVHTRHTPCGFSAYCNIAVAIRVGRDVYVFDLQNNQAAFTSCGDGIMAGKIRRNGQFIYKIDILPGLRDLNKTDGLCGKFDNNAANDRDKPSGCTKADNLCWRIEEKDSLFNKAYVQNLERWSEKLNLCTCNCSYPTCVFSDTINCGPDSREWCDIDLYKTVNHGLCFTGRRKRGADIHKYHDVQLDNFLAQKIVERSRREVTQNPLDLDTAKIICMREMNTTSVQICSELPGLDVESYYEDCARDLVAAKAIHTKPSFAIELFKTLFWLLSELSDDDLKVTNSYEWVQPHIEGLKQKCLHFVEVRQPLPQHVQEHVDLFQDYNASGTNENLVFDSDLLKRLKDASCLNECSKNGECLNGKCKCNSGYINEDCSILYSEPPEMIGIPDNGLCDLAERPCGQTMVIGRNFVESDNLSCKLVPLKVNQANQVQRGNPDVYMAELDTFLQVMCPLTSKPSQFDITTLTYGYFISVSNNREIFSIEDSIVIFNSVCLNCTKQAGLIQCQLKESGYCAHEGRCYTEGDVLGCYRCQGSPLAWSPGTDCGLPGNEETNSGKLWIIGVVFGVLIVLVVIAVLIYIFKFNSSCPRKKVNAERPLSSKPEPANEAFKPDMRRQTSTLSKQGTLSEIQLEEIQM